MKIAYTLVGLNEEDVFYFKNMERVHDLALEYRKIVYFYNNCKFMYKRVSFLMRLFYIMKIIIGMNM